ncbi:MAG TPA: CPBP family intramembrane glutamic endopeptidase [Pyrinomonadaceae bacterium]|nr:CPBP family intramembrane glutamic endopeptidase [Pyrinomonadaceae bacterium]
MSIDSQSGFPIANQDLQTQPDASSSSIVSPPLDPNDPPWGFGGALLVWLASVGLIIFLPVVFLIPYSVQRGLNPAQPDYVQKLAEFAISDKTAIFVQVLSLLPTHILTFAMVWMLVTRFGKYPFREALGWSWPRGLGLWRSVFLAFGLFALANAVGKLLGADKPTQLEQLINSSLAARYTIAILAVLTAPFVEEFVYRGILFAALQRLVGIVGAAVVVLGLFTVIHVPQYWPNFGVIAAIGLLSLALTIVRAYTGRLLPCIVIHLVFNGITSIILLVEPYLPHFEPVKDPITPPVGFLHVIIMSLIR